MRYQPERGRESPLVIGTSQWSRWVLNPQSSAPSPQPLHFLPTHPPLWRCWLRGQPWSPSILGSPHREPSGLAGQQHSPPGAWLDWCSGCPARAACPAALVLVVGSLHYTEEVRVSCGSRQPPLPWGYLHQTSLKPGPFPWPGSFGEELTTSLGLGRPKPREGQGQALRGEKCAGEAEQPASGGRQGKELLLLRWCSQGSNEQLALCPGRGQFGPDCRLWIVDCGL